MMSRCLTLCSGDDWSPVCSPVRSLIGGTHHDSIQRDVRGLGDCEINDTCYVAGIEWFHALEHRISALWVVWVALVEELGLHDSRAYFDDANGSPEELSAQCLSHR